VNFQCELNDPFGREDGLSYIQDDENMVAVYEYETTELSYIQTDAFGNVRTVFDGSGTPTTMIDYSPFGEKLLYFGDEQFPSFKQGIFKTVLGAYYFNLNSYLSESYLPKIGRSLSPSSSTGNVYDVFGGNPLR
jgi:hypothetical protein